MNKAFTKQNINIERRINITLKEYIEGFGRLPNLFGKKQGNNKILGYIT